MQEELGINDPEELRKQLAMLKQMKDSMGGMDDPQQFKTMMDNCNMLKKLMDDSDMSPEDI